VETQHPLVKFEVVNLFNRFGNLFCIIEYAHVCDFRTEDFPSEKVVRQPPVSQLVLWDNLGQGGLAVRLQVIENVVARDGVEPPTPAFSGLDSPIATYFDPKHLSSFSLRTCPTNCSQNAAMNCGCGVCLS
jgi:hypothetical protein